MRGSLVAGLLMVCEEDGPGTMLDATPAAVGLGATTLFEAGLEAGAVSAYMQYKVSVL